VTRQVSTEAAATAPDSVDDLDVAGRTLREIVWSRIRKDKVAMVCLVILVGLYLIAIFAPLITALVGVDPYSFDSGSISDSGGGPVGPWGGISVNHPLGVEWGTGRDILAQLLFGLRISLLVATTATILTVILGTTLGIISGYAGGKTDSIIGRIMDLILAFPFLLIILALSGVLTQRLTQAGVPEGNPSRILYLILVLSIFGWPYLARIVRGQVLSVREREFVEAALAMGSGRPRILFKEILPNLWAPILVYATLTLPTYIGTEAVLSFLGVGVLPPDTSFGAMLANSVSYFSVVPSYLFIPGTVLILLVVTFNLVGDAVRDALDPRAGRV
jgi:peptide/nickel transport system permease protein